MARRSKSGRGGRRNNTPSIEHLCRRDLQHAKIRLTPNDSFHIRLRRDCHSRRHVVPLSQSAISLKIIPVTAETLRIRGGAFDFLSSVFWVLREIPHDFLSGGSLPRFSSLCALFLSMKCLTRSTTYNASISNNEEMSVWSLFSIRLILLLSFLLCRLLQSNFTIAFHCTMYFRRCQSGRIRFTSVT
jgi:hypothetical protein